MVPKDRPSAEPTSDADSLSALVPAFRAVAFGQSEVRVRELTAEELPEIVEAMRPLLAAVEGGAGDFLRMIPGMMGPACAVAQATTGIAAAHWKRAGIGKLAEVVRVALELNLDFFVHGLAIGATLAVMAPRRGDGPTPSPSSPLAATPGP